MPVHWHPPSSTFHGFLKTPVSMPPLLPVPETWLDWVGTHSFGHYAVMVNWISSVQQQEHTLQKRREGLRARGRTADGVSSTGKREQHLSIFKSTFRPRGEENAGISILELVGRNSPRTRRSYTREM